MNTITDHFERDWSRCEAVDSPVDGDFVVQTLRR